MEDHLRTAEEVAKHLGTTPGALSQMRYRGLGPTFIKTGRRTVRYRASDVEAWLESQTHQPGATRQA